VFFTKVHGFDPTMINSKFKIQNQQLALSRSCGSYHDSVPSIKTTRQLSKINPYDGEFEGVRPAPQWGSGGKPPASTWLITRNLNLELQAIDQDFPLRIAQFLSTLEKNLSTLPSIFTG
jgi:hypothetical protein